MSPRGLALAFALPLASLAVAGCGDDRAGAPSPSPPASSAAPSRVARTISPCVLLAIPPRARVASRDPEGPWFYGQTVFEYLQPAPRVDGRHVNGNDSGGRSSVGWRGEALTFELPPNASVPADSLLRHGPPAAIAYRATTDGTHHVSVVVCRTDRDPPRVDLSILRRAGGGDPISATELPPHPTQNTIWSTRVNDRRMTHDATLELFAGDVIRLTAVPDLAGRDTLQLAFDLAITPPP